MINSEFMIDGKWLNKLRMATASNKIMFDQWLMIHGSPVLIQNQSDANIAE